MSKTREQYEYDLRSDSWLQKVAPEGQELCLNWLECPFTDKMEFSKAYHAWQSYKADHNLGHGEVKDCPDCQKVRFTSCSACGCGECYTCGWRWVCRPVDLRMLKPDPKQWFNPIRWGERFQFTECGGGI